MLRDKLIRAASVVPTLKRYVLEMRFKPMPRYDTGAVVHDSPATSTSPVGTLFIQPHVDTRTAQHLLLDEVLGNGFAVLAWNNNLRELLDDEIFARWKALGATFVEARPGTQLQWAGHDDPDITIVGGPHGRVEEVLRCPHRIGALPAPGPVHRRRRYRPIVKRAERQVVRRPAPDRGR